MKINDLLHKVYGTTPNDGNLQPKEALAYGIAGFGQNFICTIIGSYLTIFLTDALLFGADGVTIGSVAGILLVSSMLAWYITRVKNKLNSIIYYCLVFSMIVPFQMVMFTMSKMANILHLDNPIGIIIVYIGFGCGMSTFMFAGFIKSIPLAMEEAAMIDGATPPQIFGLVILPMLKSQAITIGILEIMWVWNDYLLPYLTIGTEYKTIPIAIQYLRGGYGAVDWGSMMAMLVLAMLPVIVFYLSCQKHIIKGVLAGAVKG